MDTDGVITTVAGDGTPGYGGDNGPATMAHLMSPHGLTVDAAGNLYIADTGNHRIRKVSPDGIIITVAGDGTAGYGGDNGPAVLGKLSQPQDVAADSEGNLYIADTANRRIRKVAPNGIITTIAGTGSGGYNGDEISAMEATLGNPGGIATDDKGNIFIADTTNHRIRRIDVSGVITTVAGNGISGFLGEAVPANQASLYLPAAVAVDRAGNLYIADTRNNRIRKVNVAGIIVTLAGDGTIGIKTGVPPREG